MEQDRKSNNHLKSPFTTTFSLKLFCYFVSLAGKKETFSLPAVKNRKRNRDNRRKRGREKGGMENEKGNEIFKMLQVKSKHSKKKNEPTSSSLHFFLSLSLYIFFVPHSFGKLFASLDMLQVPFTLLLNQKVERFYPTCSRNDGLLILWNLEQFRRELLPSSVKPTWLICELLLFINSWERFHTIRSNVFLEDVHVSVSLPFVTIDTKYDSQSITLESVL